jgi:hypothetical protein
LDAAIEAILLAATALDAAADAMRPAAAALEAEADLDAEAALDAAADAILLAEAALEAALEAAREAALTTFLLSVLILRMVAARFILREGAILYIIYTNKKNMKIWKLI